MSPVTQAKSIMKSEIMDVIDEEELSEPDINSRFSLVLDMKRASSAKKNDG